MGTKSRMKMHPYFTLAPNNGVNPTAGGRHSLSSRVRRAPAAGYTERWADIMMGRVRSQLRAV
jgi:hypothetical protein